MALPFVVCFVATPLAMLQTAPGARATSPQTGHRTPHVVAVTLLAAFGFTGIARFAYARSEMHQRLPVKVDLDRDPSVVLTDSWKDHGVWGAAAVPIMVAVSNLQSTSNKAYGLDTFVSTLQPGTALVLSAKVESDSQWVVVEGLKGRISGKLQVEETQSTTNKYFLRATKWRWVD